MNDFGNGLLVAFGIGLLIIVHEFGHYLAARWIGARVEVFSVGFGPRLFGFRRGPTDYRLSLIPLGGFVAVAGQDPADRRYPAAQCLHQKTVGQRMLFYSGGVLMNLLFALLAFPIAFHSGVSFPAPEIGGVDTGNAAWEAELQPGDRILAVNDKPTYSFENLIVEVALAGSGPVALQVRRGDQERTVEVRPQFQPTDGIYALGIAPIYEDLAPEILVTSGGPAARAGLRDGDVLLAIDGLPTTGAERAKAYRRLGDQPAAVRVRRGRDELAATVAPVLQPDAGFVIGVQQLPRVVGGIRPGLRLLSDLQLEHGDVVLAIDGLTFRAGDFTQVRDGSGPLTIVVQRGGRVRSLQSREPSRDDRQQFADHVALVPELTGVVLMPQPDGMALQSGMQNGDRLLAIDGQPVASWNELRHRVQAARDRELQLQVERPAAIWEGPPTLLQLRVKPAPRQLYDFGLQYRLTEKRAVVRATGVVDAIRLGCVCSLDLVKQLYVTVKRLLTGDVAAKNLGGIITISRVSYLNARWGLVRFLYFLAVLSINLAFINVLPIPVLDGGHLLFLLIERVKGSPVSTRVLTYSQILGLVLVLALVVFVTYNDILRLL